MADQFDVVVLGSGPGGYVAAIRAAQLGLKTAIVERESLGGICLNWGCIPTKALLRSAEVFHLVKHADSYGLSAAQFGFDLQKVVQRSRAVAKQLNQGVTHLMKKNKIAVHMGEGTLTGPTSLTVKSEKGEGKLSANHGIVATRARARDREQDQAGAHEPRHQPAREALKTGRIGETMEHHPAPEHGVGSRPLPSDKGPQVERSGEEEGETFPAAATENLQPLPLGEGRRA